MLTTIRQAAGRVAVPAAVALAVVLVAAPTGAAVAAKVAKTLITDAQGDKAQVTKSGQLLTAPAPGTALRVGWLSALSPAAGCKKVIGPPKGKGLIVTQANLNVYANPSPGPGNWLGLFTNAACTTTLQLVNAPTVGMWPVEFGDGFPIRPGQGLYARALGSVSGEVTVFGTVVSKTDVPSGQLLPRSGPPVQKPAS